MMDSHFLDEARDLPSKVHASQAGKSGMTPMERVVAWSVFRTRAEAENLVAHVHLAPGQHLVGGHGQDSVAPFWWVGVQVSNLGEWGHSAAINKRGRHGD
ncbi:hypothetical protein HJG40_12665 [Acidithiobacillus sp. ATCC 19703]|uniref:Uncharacterized protein n=2 Tax=Acidithiobacillus concretivorus TaxID=3063952 RepID=A0ABS5ZUH9_9PROT|nr:hypothetical protein [Acidithiobacillus concretivorus]